jgi:hypothetical protein
MRFKKCWYCGEDYLYTLKRCPFCNRLWKTQYKIKKKKGLLDKIKKFVKWD